MQLASVLVNLKGGNVGFLKLSTSLLHSIALSSNHDVYVWGSNRYGILGLGSSLSDCKNKVQPTKITQNFKLLRGEYITEIQAVYWNSFFLTSQNRLFMCGRNIFDLKINEGGNNHSILNPVDVTWLFNLSEDDCFVSISTMMMSGVFISEKGRVFTVNEEFLMDKVWVKGNEVIKERTEHFKLYDDEKIIKGVCSNSQFYVLSNKGRLFMWGILNSDCEECFDIEIPNSLSSHPISSLIDEMEQFIEIKRVICIPKNVTSFLDFFWGEKIIDLVDGLIVTSLGRVKLLDSKLSFFDVVSTELNNKIDNYLEDKIVFAKATFRGNYILQSENGVLYEANEEKGIEIISYLPSVKIVDCFHNSDVIQFLGSDGVIYQKYLNKAHQQELFNNYMKHIDGNIYENYTIFMVQDN